MSTRVVYLVPDPYDKARPLIPIGEITRDRFGSVSFRTRQWELCETAFRLSVEQRACIRMACKDLASWRRINSLPVSIGSMFVLGSKD